jgi:hypothetical protein
LRNDPAGFLHFVEKLLATRHFDVLLPTHEQGFLFARVLQRLTDRVGLALPDFDSYRTAHSKAGFSRLLDQLALPQPPTRIKPQMPPGGALPSVIKTSVGTAPGIWFEGTQRSHIAMISINVAFAEVLAGSRHRHDEKLQRG